MVRWAGVSPAVGASVRAGGAIPSKGCFSRALKLTLVLAKRDILNCGRQMRHGVGASAEEADFQKGSSPGSPEFGADCAMLCSREVGSYSNG